MPKIKVITGLVPLEEHPRKAVEYGALGERLAAAVSPVAPIKAFYSLLPHCWLHKFVWETGGAITHSSGDNPEKNTLAYHCVQHQKIDWLRQAAAEDPEPDTFVWIDYGIMHVPGVTMPVIREFLARVAETHQN